MAKNVLITGASSGIGEATAKHLSKLGWHVFGASRRPLGEQLSARSLTMDVRDSDSVRNAVAQFFDECGHMDALICNAGVGIFGATEEVSIENAQSQFDTNYFGTLRVLREVIPRMRQAKGGRILLVGSLAGRAPLPFQSHYSSSKAAIDALSAALYTELAPFGVHVSLIEPGDISTPFNDAVNWKAGHEQSAYGEAIERCETKNRQLLLKAPRPEVAAHCIARALRAKRPRSRYTVGASSRLVPIARRILPDRISLALIRRHYNL
ncbi:MAG: short-chain dehydrogenase/reductase [Deltaproteobacteria bacterium]|nr:short-chain dehydrogenase/reductase [Deltaproteobacteria bacterium]